MKWLPPVLLLFVSFTLSWSDGLSPTSLSPAEVSDLFSQAKRYFDEANEIRAANPGRAAELYRRSALYFERIAKEGGIRNGKLFYNIGNVYFRLGDIGRAILNYRRAEKLIPNDPNLVQNLDFARSRRIDQIEIEEAAAIARILFFWHFDLPSRSRAIIFSICFVLIWVFAALRLLIRRSGFSWTALGFAAAAALFLGSLVWESVDGRRNLAGVIVAEESIGRKGNSETYQPSFREPLHAGAEFVVREDRGEWLLVRLPDGRETWLLRKTVGLVE